MSIATPELFFPALGKRLAQTQRQALLVVPQNEDRFNLYTHICHFASNSKIYVLDDLDEVSKNALQATDDGNFSLVPGPVHQYLQNAKTGDILIINFMNLKPQHVGYNSVIDSDQRALDGTRIPEGVNVLVITSEECYPRLREDMLSRFPRSEGLIIKLPVWPLAKEKAAMIDDAFPIELYEREDWEEYLIGQLKLINGKLYANRGLVFDALQKPLLLINPPKGSNKFNTFAATGQFDFNGQSYQLLRPIKTMTREYKFDHNAMAEKPKQSPQAIDWVLNKLTFRYIHTTQSYDKSANTTIQALSIIDQLPDHATIWVTSNLTKCEWFYLLKSCQEKNKKFYFQKANKHIKVPKQIKHLIPAKEAKSETLNSRFKIIHCNDPSYVLTRLTHESKEQPILFGLDQRPHGDLIENWSVCESKQANNLPTFILNYGELIKALIDGKTVIVHGSFSAEFENLIASLFIDSPYLMFNGKKEPIKQGQLIVLCEDKKNFSFVKQHQTIKTVLTEKLELLGLLEAKEKSLFEVFKTTVQAASCIKEPDYNALRALWQGYQISKDNALLTYQYLTTNKSKLSLPSLPQNQRLELLSQTLLTSRSVFLTGPSGTGKSSTVLNDLPLHLLSKTNANVKLMVGLEQLSEWSKMPGSHEMRILFIDEANLVQGVDQLIALHDEPQPHVLINGQRILLTPQHKIIFAGNSLEYAGRENHPIFECSQPIFFSPCSFEEIFEKQLLPILKTVISQPNEFKVVFTSFKTAYAKALQVKNNQDKLITTRNIEMMAMLFAIQMLKEKQPYSSDSTVELAMDLSNTMDTTSENKAVANHSAWVTMEVIKDLLPIDGLEKEIIPSTLKEKLIQQKFLLTPTHARTMICLQQMLDTRNFVLQYPEFSKSATRGLLLEGPSGIGKSAAAVKFLLTQGFTQVDPMAEEKENESQNKFCILTPTHPEKMLAVLNKAFHRGWIIVMDEINSLPIEGWLNAFMSGVDLEGKRAHVPGFNVIGTMNPGDFPGRQPLSPAFINRFRQIQLNDYTREEVVEIVRFNYPELSNEKLSGLAELYIESKKGREIPFTLRDILRIAAKENKNHLIVADEKIVAMESKMDVPDVKPAPHIQKGQKRSREEEINAANGEQANKRIKIYSPVISLFAPPVSSPSAPASQKTAMEANGI